jgi:predicted TIM-barrel enzyme
VKTEKPDWKAKLVSAAARGQFLVGAGAGTGLSAKCAEAGGADLIIIYNSGRFRMAGRGSLAGMMPYGDANAIVLDMAREVLPIVRQTPVLAGVCGTDPFRLMDVFLRELRDMGFAGVQNFPTVGLIDGMFRLNLEETGMGFSAEIDMIARAHELGLLTCPYVFDEQQAREMARAGADLLVAHAGLTTKGSVGAHSAMTLEEAAGFVRSIIEAGKNERNDVLVLCHGGPIAEPADVGWVIEHTLGLDGFFGASSIERLAAEVAITEQTRRFKSLRPAQETMPPQARDGRGQSDAEQK